MTTAAINRNRRLLTLSHYSAHKIDALYNTEPLDYGTPMPRGLWLSNGPDWFNHACSHSCQHGVKHKYEVEYDPEDICQIKSRRDVAYYINYFGYQDPDDFDEDDPYGNDAWWYIDWERIAEKYKGVHVHAAALDNTYLSPFDIESVCIWDTSAIISMEEV